MAVEIPADFYLLTQEVDAFTYDPPPVDPPQATAAELDAAADVLNRARRPLLYLGAGARSAGAHLVELAERLGAPVATTIQGKGVFPEHHPLWLWNGLGGSAPRFVRMIEAECDAMLAVGCRFSEVGTASWSFTPPTMLVHVDIEAGVLNRNFPAQVAIHSDAGVFARAVLPLVAPREPGATPWKEQIASGQRDVREAWAKDASDGRVTPAAFFAALERMAPQAIYTTDSGNGTFLAMEHLRLPAPGPFLPPGDFSRMRYAVPAAVGAKLANPDRDVIALAGDGALLMTGLVTLTAASYGAAALVCVLRDGALAQIAQFQRTALDRDTCSVLPPYSVEHFAATTGAHYVRLGTDAEIDRVLGGALERTRRGQVVMVEVAIDYSHKTYFTRGVVATNFWRLPMTERLRMLGRAVTRRLR